MHKGEEADSQRILGQTRVFSGCSTADLGRITALARPFRATAGEVITRQGDAADGLYALLHGSASAHMRLPAGNAIRLDDIGFGATCDWSQIPLQ